MFNSEDFLSIVSRTRFNDSVFTQKYQCRRLRDLEILGRIKYFCNFAEVSEIKYDR